MSLLPLLIFELLLAVTAVAGLGFGFGLFSVGRRSPATDAWRSTYGPTMKLVGVSATLLAIALPALGRGQRWPTWVVVAGAVLVLAAGAVARVRARHPLRFRWRNAGSALIWAVLFGAAISKETGWEPSLRSPLLGLVVAAGFAVEWLLLPLVQRSSPPGT